MAIKRIVEDFTGQVGVVPRLIRVETTDTLSDITSAGYLDSSVRQGYTFSTNDVVFVSHTNGVTQCDVTISGGVITLAPSESGVVLPVTVDHIATYTDTIGTIGDDPTTAITGGNLQAGLSGTAGYVASFPSAATKGSLRLTAVANTGDTVTTISNAAMGQASVISIPDPAQATAEFIISDSAGTQHITSGSLDVDAGSLISGLAAGGFAGSAILYSNTASMGSLRLLAVDSAGDFAVTISNASHGQASVISIPDGGQATSEFIIADSAGTQHITSGGLQVDAGAISGGLAAGGFAGALNLYSNTASMGSLRLLTVDNGGDFAVTISNASHGQASVISIPDGGQATSEFIIADSAGTQTITSGNLSVAAGTLAASGNITSSTGNVTAGSDGNAGTFISYPTTGTNGTFIMAAVDAGGAFNTTVSNSAMGQSSVVSIPDPGNATADFVLTESGGTQSIASGNLSVAAGTLAASGNISSSGGNVVATTGNLQAGSDGNVGTVTSYPATATNGSLILAAVDAGGAFNTTISNAIMGQSTVFTIPDVGAATGSILVSAVAADAGANLISFDVTVGQAALATGGSVTLYASSGTKQYRVRNLYMNSGGTNFAGGGGDREGAITDGTTIYSVIPGANMQALTNEIWGGTTALPLPASDALNTPTAAGASLVMQYSGGTTDYTAGSVVISGILERIA